MPGDRSRERTSCPVRSEALVNNQAVARHMQRWHTMEWANFGPGRQVIFYPCDQPGCNQLGNNTRYDFYVAHLGRNHGIDPPSIVRTTESWYLESKTKAVLEMHVVQEARELNEVNTKIRNLEACLAADPPPGGYTSCHGFDVRTFFKTSLGLIPQTKPGLVAYLQQIRNYRNQLGSLYTNPGVIDTRNGVLDDLETLLDTPDSVNVDDSEALLDDRGGILDDLKTLR